MNFVQPHAKRGADLPKAGPGGTHPDAVDEAEYVRRLRNPKTCDAAVLALVREVGLDALLPGPFADPCLACRFLARRLQC